MAKVTREPDFEFYFICVQLFTCMADLLLWKDSPFFTLNLVFHGDEFYFILNEVQKGHKVSIEVFAF